MSDSGNMKIQGLGFYGIGATPAPRLEQQILLLCEGVTFAPEPPAMRNFISDLSLGPRTVQEHCSGARFNLLSCVTRPGRNGEVLCSAAFWNRCAEEAELEFIVVASEARQSGLGSFLMHSSHQFLWAIGVRRVVLEVAWTNRAALHLYQKLGYERIGFRKAYYRNGDDAVVLALTSPFSV